MKQKEVQKKNKQFKTNKYSLVGVLFQLLVTVVAVVLGIIALIKGNVFIDITQVVVGIDFLVMSYNNKWVYNRDKFTVLYLIVGIICILSGTIGIVRRYV